MLAWRMGTIRCGSAVLTSEFGLPLGAPLLNVGLFQCWPHPEGNRGLLHPPIKAGQMSAVAVQRHRQMQGVTRAQAEPRILDQIRCLAKAVAIEGAQFHSALQQALELLPSHLACC